APGCIDLGRLGLQHQVDLVLAVEVRAAQRDPVLGPGAGEIVLREVRPVAGRRVVAAQHGDSAGIALAPQHLGAGEARGAAADDDDAFGRQVAGTRLLGFLRLLVAHEDLAARLLDAPARHGTEGRRLQRLAAAQAEAGVVPRAAHAVADQDAFGERAAVMRASRADGEDL